MKNICRRDAGNYKQHEGIVLAGALTLAQAHTLMDATDKGDGIVQSVVGSDDLQERMINGWQTDVEHPFHEISLLSLVDDDAATGQIAEGGWPGSWPPTERPKQSALNANTPLERAEGRAARLPPRPVPLIYCSIATLGLAARGNEILWIRSLVVALF